MTVGIANDKVSIKSAREYDGFGRLHVEKANISKETVNPYFGKEIPNWQSLGLESEKVYKLYRPQSELEKAADTFKRLPILSEHLTFTLDDPRKAETIGTIGSNVVFESPYLTADLSFWDKAAIGGIEENQIKELSCSYSYVPVMESGEFNGEPYDGVMTEIIGNHLALVENGRAGSDVVVADNNPFINEDKIMKRLDLKAAIQKVLGKKPEPLASGEEIDTQRVDAILDAVLGVEDDSKENTDPADPVEPVVPAVDETPADKIKAMLSGKVDDDVISSIIALIAEPAKDEGKEEEDNMKKEDVKQAMDSMKSSMQVSFKELAQAERDVRDTVGDVQAMDSAAEVYGFALNHLKVAHDGIEDVNALRLLFKLAADKTASANTNPANDSQPEMASGLVGHIRLI